MPEQKPECFLILCRCHCEHSGHLKVLKSHHQHLSCDVCPCLYIVCSQQMEIHAYSANINYSQLIENICYLNVNVVFLY